LAYSIQRMKIVPKIFNPSTVTAAQSTRMGGVSAAPYDSLNLGKSTNDDPIQVEENRRLFFGSLNVSHRNISLSKQVHGNQILVVNEPVITEGYDAMITNKKHTFLAVSIADCVPILIHDVKNNAVAAIHAGWRGTVGNIVFKTIEKMNEHFSTLGENCHAYIGACIGYNKFEVGEEVANEFSGEFKRSGTNGKYFVDLKTANAAQLKLAGVQDKNIEISSFCTVENNDMFFSHRKEKGITGRMMATIGII